MTDRTYAEIDVFAIRHNISLVREKAGDAKIMCMVKANAYGHGSIAVAKYCEDLLDYFGVATVEEGILLRRAGITLPILTVGDTPRSRFCHSIDYGIEMTVHSLESAKRLNDFCKSKGATANIHIAIDTGMGRIGFLPSEIDEAVEVSMMSNLKIKGIFTHFAKADEVDKSYTYMQKKLFDNFVQELESRGVDAGLRHVANSASILDIPSFNCDMVRMGIVTYGLCPSSAVKCEELLPAMSLHSHIVHVKTLPKGRRISYGGDFLTQRDTKVATVAVGYGDGYPRALSGKGYVLVRGRRAPILGRICMDQTMIDVTHIDGVSVDDKVTLIGRQGDEYVSADEIARLAGTINYEIVCGISPRVERVYVSTNLEIR